jgi:hypothetical protein
VKTPIRSAATTITTAGTISFALRMGPSLRVVPSLRGVRGSCRGRYAQALGADVEVSRA